MLLIYLINGAMMDTRENLHSHLYLQFGLPAHYGRNLDALWDCLREKEPGCIVFQRAECVDNALLLPLVGLLLDLVRRDGAWQLQLSTGSPDCHNDRLSVPETLYDAHDACAACAGCSAATPTEKEKNTWPFLS